MKKLLIIFCTITFIQCKQKTETINETKTTQEKEKLSYATAEKIQSKHLSEERKLNVYLPKDYHPDSTKTYNTIYLLDGSAHEDFPHITGLVQFMKLSQQMPEMIVVGIENVDRKRDFTYPSKDSLDIKDFPTQGGSAKFISFIKNEVKPLINKNYKTNKHDILIGQSFGGLLATEILLNHKNLFDDYIIISPSLWWDRFTMLKNSDELFLKNDYSKKAVFLSVGKEHPTMNKVADELAKRLKKSNVLNFHYKINLDEDHATILHPAVFDAFKTLYKIKKEEQKK